MALEGVEFVTLRPVADTESTRLADADRDLATFCFGLPATRAVGLTTSSAPLLARRCSPLRISPTSNLGLGRAAEVLRSLLVCFGWTSTVAGAYPALDGGVPFTLPVLVWGARTGIAPCTLSYKGSGCSAERIMLIVDTRTGEGSCYTAKKGRSRP